MPDETAPHQEKELELEPVAVKPDGAAGQSSAMRSSKGASRSFAWNHIYKLSEYGLITMYSILIVRKFGPVLAAPYAVYLSIAGLLPMLASFGVDGVLLRYIPRITNKQNEEYSLIPFLQDLFSFRLYIISIIVVLLVASAVLLPTLLSTASWLGALESLWPYLVLYLFSQACVAFATFSLIGLFEVKWIFFASLISRSLLLGAGIVLVTSFPVTVSAAVSLHALAAALNAVLLFFWLLRELRKYEDHAFLREKMRAKIGSIFRRSFEFLRKPSTVRAFIVTPFMLYGLATWGSDFFATILGKQPDILMMRFLLGEKAKDIGLYTAAAMVLQVTEYVFLFGLSQTLTSVFSGYAHLDEVETSHTSYPRLLAARREIFQFQTASTMPLFIFTFFFAPIIVEVVFGSKFMDAVPFIRCGVAFLATTVTVFAGGMQITSLIAMGKERLAFRNRLCWAIINTVGNYFMILFFGGFGAIIGTQFSDMGACATESWMADRRIGRAADLWLTLRVAIIAASAAAIPFFLLAQLQDILPPIVQLAIALVLTFGLTLCGYLLFKVHVAKRVIAKIWQLSLPFRTRNA